MTNTKAELAIQAAKSSWLVRLFQQEQLNLEEKKEVLKSIINEYKKKKRVKTCQKQNWVQEQDSKLSNDQQ
jgi:uncharacterized protein YlxP (DUF503 family)